MTYACEGTINAPENKSVATSFMHLKLRSEFKEDYVKAEEKQGRDWITH